MNQYNVNWVLKLYDLNGNSVTGDDMDGLDATNQIRRAFNRVWTVNLNSFDQLDFSLYLNDPMAAQISRGLNVVKLYRTITAPDDTVILDGTDSPCFAGVVGYTNKVGSTNQMDISCYSPLWRLQFHFHILNHYLLDNPDTGEIWTQSELMWKLIDLVDQAFGGDSHTGISLGALGVDYPDEPQIGPYLVPKGGNTWSIIFQDLMLRPSSPDILPGYVHSEGDENMMEFNTYLKRGIDRGTDTYFLYRSQVGDHKANLDDLEESVQLTPGSFANYLWVIGAGGPNSGRYSVASDPSDDGDGYGNIGVYMTTIDHDEITTYPQLGPIADAALAQMKSPVATYTVTVSPASNIFWDIDFTMGDVVHLIGDKGALQVDKKQRIYQGTMSMSDNNIETAQVLVAKDFYGTVEEDG